MSSQVNMDYDKILGVAKDAFDEGRTRSESFRKDQLKALMRMMKENAHKFEAAVYRDFRKPKQETVLTELLQVTNDIQLALENIKKWMKPDSKPRTLMTMIDSCFVHKEPYGVVLIMSAWNYPIQLALLPVIGAISAGNCVVLKPSEGSSATADLLAELFPKYLDQDCYHCIVGSVADTIDLLKRRFDFIFYTGSTQVGRLVREAANKFLTPVTLELGGKSPVYIDTSCDMTIAVRRLLWGKTVNAGQTCVAPDYVMCTRETQDKLLSTARKVLAEFYGNDVQSSADLSRIVNEKHVLRIESMMKSSGTVALGGKVEVQDRYIEPTILINIKPTDPIMQDEIFGPVLPIMLVAGPEEAIKYINSKEKPLTLYVFSTKKTVLDAFVNNTSSGSICANDTLIHLSVENLPFGGVGYSGMGKYHGKHSFDEFTHEKSVLVRNYFGIGEKLAAARYPPYSESKLRQLTPLLKHRNFPKLGPLAYVATFALGVLATLAVQYSIKSIYGDE